MLNDRVGLPEATLAELREIIADHGMLNRAIRWAMSAEPPRPVALVVVQDEYTHDIVVPWRDGLVLVYDCT